MISHSPPDWNDVVRIFSRNDSSDSHDLFDVKIFSDTVETLVTTSPSKVDAWIAHVDRLSPLAVGLDVEWRPSLASHVRSPVATLQLCAGTHCLIFQLLHSHGRLVPQSLRDFLAEPRYSFVGVGVEDDAQKLLHDYGLWVGNAVDIGGLAARAYGDRQMRGKGLMELARIVLGMMIRKPREVTMSLWDNRWLSCDQVRYACVDAYVSFMLGNELISGR